MKHFSITIILIICSTVGLALTPTAFAGTFSYLPPGDLVPGSGQGRVDYKVYLPGMRFPVQKAPAYANSQVWGVGGMNGPGGSECHADNYSYPWRDNYCEKRGWPMPLCPSGTGHQGQDIRPSTCTDSAYWAVAAEGGTITYIGSYSVSLQGDSGIRHSYLHLNHSTLSVWVGKRVAKGDKIGKISDNMGSTATTIHLHYAMKSGGIYIPTYMSLVRSYEDLIDLPRRKTVLMDTDFDGAHNIKQSYGRGDQEDQYLVGDWDGDGRDNLAVRRGNKIYMDTDFDGTHNILQTYGVGNLEDDYLVGDWDGDGRDNIAVRRGNKILMDTNFDGAHDIYQSYGMGDAEDQYLVGDWDGDGRDNIAVRRWGKILMDTNFDGAHDILQHYGNGGSEDQYLVGDWDGDGRDNIAVRRGNKILMDTNFDGGHNVLQGYGAGNAEAEYLSGDWDGDGRSNVAVRRAP
ncbi:MAG: M23 family metallopeptidase [Desulfobacterales bacterium]|jgi:murein DD-endopeptidase MepM/ murein hydrolase activator NlpD